MPDLSKVRVGDFAPIVRAIYAEETDAFLNQYHQQAGNGLDACVNTTVANIGESRFFKVENEFGALVGFFTTAYVNENYVMPSFHVRATFRTPEYLAAFWGLVRDTFDNNFLTSVGVQNYKALNHLLKNSFEIVNDFVYEGKDFVILINYL